MKKLNIFVQNKIMLFQKTKLWKKLTNGAKSFT